MEVRTLLCREYVLGLNRTALDRSWSRQSALSACHVGHLDPECENFIVLLWWLLLAQNPDGQYETLALSSLLSKGTLRPHIDLTTGAFNPEYAVGEA